MKKNSVSRRDILKVGVGSAAVLGSTAVLASGHQTTPAQVEGPFYPIHAQDDKDADLTRVSSATARAEGEIIVVAGSVKDENGEPIANAVVDVWQANAAGRYAHEEDSNTAPLDANFQGWAILKTDAEGKYRFKTIKPGAYPATDDWDRPPHIHYKVSRRGYREITTQMYFPGDKLNEVDPLLNEVDEPARSALIANKESLSDDADTKDLYRFDVVIASV